ncbi:MAG: hypothetical protein IJS69_05985, partial [Selenomonadaceae bacterium]|nr:hypothetical protein [Selenomonadaceae bacterium]
MKKFLIAVAMSLLILGGHTGTEAATVDNLNNTGIETQEMSAWPKIRDSILGRDKHNYNRNHHNNYRDDHHHHYGPPPPPPRHH